MVRHIKKAKKYSMASTEKSTEPQVSTPNPITLIIWFPQNTKMHPMQPLDINRNSLSIKFGGVQAVICLAIKRFHLHGELLYIILTWVLIGFKLIVILV